MELLRDVRWFLREVREEWRTTPWWGRLLYAVVIGAALAGVLTLLGGIVLALTR